MTKFLTLFLKLFMGLIWLIALLFAAVAVVLAIPFLLLVCAYLWVRRSRAADSFEGI